MADPHLCGQLFQITPMISLHHRFRFCLKMRYFQLIRERKSPVLPRPHSSLNILCRKWTHVLITCQQRLPNPRGLHAPHPHVYTQKSGLQDKTNRHLSLLPRIIVNSFGLNYPLPFLGITTVLCYLGKRAVIVE